MRTRTECIHSLLLSLLAALMVLSLVACGQKPPATEAPPEVSAPPAEGEKVSLRLWAHQNPTFNAGYEALIAAYQEAHPDVQITLETFEYDTYIQTLQTTMPSGEEADVLSMFGTWTCQYAERLSPVPEDVMTLAEAEDLYYAAPVGGFTCDGKLYGLPQEFNIEYGGVLVNKTMYEAAGLTYPPKWETMDDVLKDGQALSKFDDAGVMTVAGFDFNAGDPASFWFLAGINQRGGDYWKADHTGFTFDTPEAKETLEYMLSAVKDWQVLDPVLFNDAQNWVGSAFFEGKVAIGYIGPWAVSMGVTDYPDFKDEYGYFVLPAVGDEPIFVADSGWGLVVSPNSEHKDVAWDFAKFATANKDNALQWNVTSSTIPAIPENAESPELATALPWITEELKQLSYGRYMGGMPDRDLVVYEVIYPHILNALQGLETVDEALQAMDAEANATFD